MRHVSTITISPDRTEQPKQRGQVHLDEAAAQVVGALFRELKAIFPAWRQAWPTADDEAAARRCWIKAFADAGLCDINAIRGGIVKSRRAGRSFMPSVGEFISWCRPAPEQLGCPSVRTAYLQACRLAHPSADRSSAHPAVWHAACEVGLSVLCELPEQKSRPLFERAYGITMGMLLRGDPLREIPKALPESVSVPASPERVRSALNEMRRRLAGSKVAV